MELATPGRAMWPVGSGESLEGLVPTSGLPVGRVAGTSSAARSGKRQVALEKRGAVESHLTEQNGCTVEAVLAEAAAEDRMPCRGGWRPNRSGWPTWSSSVSPSPSSACRKT